MRACRCLTDETLQRASMKVPPKRKGNNPAQRGRLCDGQASMKVPPKRKGNGSFFEVIGVAPPPQ